MAIFPEGSAKIGRFRPAAPSGSGRRQIRQVIEFHEAFHKVGRFRLRLRAVPLYVLPIRMHFQNGRAKRVDHFPKASAPNRSLPTCGSKWFRPSVNQAGNRIPRGFPPNFGHLRPRLQAVRSYTRRMGRSGGGGQLRILSRTDITSVNAHGCHNVRTRWLSRRPSANSPTNKTGQGMCTQNESNYCPSLVIRSIWDFKKLYF